MLNIRFIIKMLGMMFILETLFMLAATAVAFLYEGNDFYPLLQSSGIMFGTGVYEPMNIRPGAGKGC